MGSAAKTISRWEWLILLLLLPLFLFPTGWRGLVLLIIPILWLLRKIATGYFIPHTPYDATLLALAVALLISLAAVFDMALSFPKIAGLVFGIAVFYTAVQYARDREKGKYYLLSLFFVLGTIIVTIGVLGTLQSSIFAFLSPVLALVPASIIAILDFLPTVNPNELAGILCWVVPLLLACTVGFWSPLWQTRRWSHKLLLAIMFLLLVFNTSLLIASRSRGGLLAVLISLLVMLAIKFQWGRWLLLIIVIAVIALGLFVDLGPLLEGDVQAGIDLGLNGRLEIWSRALYGLADFPFTGMSMNGFRHVVHILYPLFTIPPNTDIGHAHNQLLQAGLDLGFLGLIAYLAIWVLSAALLWIGWRQTRNRSYQVLLVGLSGSLMAGWIFGILDAIALGARPGFLWWMLLALVVTVFDHTR